MSYISVSFDASEIAEMRSHSDHSDDRMSFKLPRVPGEGCHRYIIGDPASLRAAAERLERAADDLDRLRRAPDPDSALDLSTTPNR